MSAPLREASSVLLLREAPSGFEILMLRRVKGGAWGSAFVFPGGVAAPDEDARMAAARELFEEAGILLANDTADENETMEIADLPMLRKDLLEGRDAKAMLAASGLAWATDHLVPWAHWITPSSEPKRFSARFFVCELPPGQVSSQDDVETVEQLWIRPADGLARAGELALPPPQVRTLWELAQHDSVQAVLAAGRVRAAEPHPIMPRLRALEAGPAPCLLLPWDPDYMELGTGDATPMAYTPSWATGPSRFVREQDSWKHVVAPGSTVAG